jgi:peptide/nickel transport system permease protein
MKTDHDGKGLSQPMADTPGPAATVDPVPAIAGMGPDEQPAGPRAGGGAGVGGTLRSFFLGSPLSIACTAVIGAWALLGIFGPLVSPFDPYTPAVSERLSPPSAGHWFGTDEFGRDLATRLFQGARVSLAVGLATVLASSLVGITLGALAGFYRRLSGVLMRIIDAFLAFPSLLLAIVLVAVVGQGIPQMLVALVSVYAPLFARVVYGEVKALKELEYAQSAKALGASNLRILARHLLPSMTSPLIVQGSFVLATAIIFEASLSFVGAGIPAPQPSWGSMVSAGKIYLLNAPWMLWPPALALTSLVLSVSLLGDRLRDVLDPRSLSRVG